MTSSITGVIFDFNGTLFNDTAFHNEAWSKFAEQNKLVLTAEDLETLIHGHTNKEILEFLYKKVLSNNELKKYYEEKEAIYRNICTNNPKACILAPGAEFFINYLHNNNIKKTIATASYPKNVEFYFSIFNLARWFNINQVIHDNGEYRGKPFPDMFLAAAKEIQVPINECMIIEDSFAGIQAAKNAKAGKIIAKTTNDNLDKFSEFKYIDQVIIDFKQINRNCLNI